MEISNCLRSMSGVTYRDIMRNKKVIRTTGVTKELAGRARQCG